MHYGIKNEITGEIIAAHPTPGRFGKCKMELLAARENKNRRKVRGKLVVVPGTLNAGGFFELEQEIIDATAGIDSALERDMKRV